MQFPECIDRFPRVVHGDTVERHPRVVPVAVPELIELGKLVDAGRAPGRPEVDEHDLSLEFGEIHLVAVAGEDVQVLLGRELRESRLPLGGFQVRREDEGDAEGDQDRGDQDDGAGSHAADPAGTRTLVPGAAA